ncbi:MAG TPA: DUF1801 domain-containing protein [Capsulimonadaceae bacterium]|jgi:uncharacterized protein YdeI (YjbR/CyaY-like superfamily)
MNETNPKIDAYISNSKQWQVVMQHLRVILLQCPLTEEMKWGQPCYTAHGANIAILGPMKRHCALSFFKGSLLSDPHKLLVQPGKNTQAGRWIQFTSPEQVDAMAAIINAYILEAIALEQAGAKVEYKSTAEYAVPGEFQVALDGNPELKAAFDMLTPGRQRAYLLYFAAAKQAKTREARIEKCTPQILSAKGLNDQ